MHFMPGDKERWMANSTVAPQFSMMIVCSYKSHQIKQDYLVIVFQASLIYSLHVDISCYLFDLVHDIV